MTLDNRYGMRVTEESAPGSDIGRPRDQSLVPNHHRDRSTSVLPGSRETCEVEGEDFTVDKIPNTRCFNCLCKVKKKEKNLSLYDLCRFRFHYSPRRSTYSLGSSALTFYVIIRRDKSRFNYRSR